jgi:lysophospholipase L1-like esterase
VAPFSCRSVAPACGSSLLRPTEFGSAQTSGFDGNAVFSYPFTLGHVSGSDYFHPNTTGQQVLAEQTYAAGFGW